MPQIALRLIEPDGTTNEMPPRGGLTIGRAEGSGCRVGDEAVAETHARVRGGDGEALVLEAVDAPIELGDGGTLAAGETHELSLGLKCTLGGTSLEVVMIDEPDQGLDSTIALRAGHLDNLSQLAAQQAAKARLVVASDALRTRVDIVGGEFTIGRKDENDLTIDHGAVSSRHAKIFFKADRFFIEDLGSTNGTFIGDEMLAPNAPREIQPETHVRFGSIDALFVAETDASGKSISREQRRRACDILEIEGSATRIQCERAERDAESDDRHVGEVLLLEGIVTVAQWVEAQNNARISHIVEKTTGEQAMSPGKIIIILAIAALIVLGILYGPRLLEAMG